MNFVSYSNINDMFASTSEMKEKNYFKHTLQNLVFFLYITK